MIWPDEDGLCKHLMVFETCTLCNGREKAEANAAKQIVARGHVLPGYSFCCFLCQHTGEEGDPIAKRADGAWVHEECST